jgi:diguanylate cyclase (GGDEF)-like protein
VVDHSRIQHALSEFAQLLLEDFSVPDVLQRLCEHVVPAVDVAGAGVSLREADGVRVAWASGPDVLRLEDLQRELHEGPCLDVLDLDAHLQVLLADEADRWPRYSEQAGRLGVRRMAAFPLRARGHTWGVLDLYRHDERVFTPDELAAAQVLTGTATAYVLAAHDRQARRLAEDELRLQALHDPLTGLPNRLLVLERLHQLLAVVARRPASAGLLFLDLDRFKQVNDAYGHAAGDRLLTAVAARLADALRPTDTLARLGGDEFVVLCEDLHPDSEELAAIGERLLAHLARPVPMPELPGGEVVVRASIGAVRLVQGDTPEEVLHHADTAMYVAKRRGTGVAVSDRAYDALAAVGVRTDAELRHALDRGQLRLAFQPVVALPGGGPAGLEALLRWQHPGRGLLPAAQFLPALERTGLVVPVGGWVLREVCRRLPDLRPPDAPDDWFVAVNVSVQQVHAPDFLDQLEQVLSQTAADPGRLLLEVTETALVPSEQVLTARLREVSRLGIRVALDDFGTGYSSLSHLTRLPAQVLKIDKSFVSGLGVDRRDQAVVRGTISLAHDLGLTVIAEGVERPDQHEVLALAGCDAGQGHLYGRPALVSPS